MFSAFKRSLTFFFVLLTLFLFVVNTLDPAPGRRRGRRRGHGFGRWNSSPIPGWMLPGSPANVANPAFLRFDSGLPGWASPSSTSEAVGNAYKYWQYRDRLRAHFINFGEEVNVPGESPKPVKPQADGSCLIPELIYHGTDLEAEDDPDTPENEQDWYFAHWGDATIKLGWYMGVLATEIKLLTDPKTAHFGQPVDLENAVKELYCALVALERLDRFGEQKMWDSHPVKLSRMLGTDTAPTWPDTRGFFIRDDVDDATVDRMGGLIGGLSDNMLSYGLDAVFDGFGEELGDQIKGYYFQTIEDDLPAEKPAPYQLKEMSQDQVIHLLLGIALVKKFVPESVVYNGKGLRAWAVTKARDMVEYISKDHYSRKSHLWIPWIIEDPVSPQSRYAKVCDKCVEIPYFDPFHATDSDDMEPVARGSGAYSFAPGLARAIDWIDEATYVDYKTVTLWKWTFPVPEKLHIGVTPSIVDVPLAATGVWVGFPSGAETVAEGLSVLGDLVFSLFGIHLIDSPADNEHMTMALAAIGDWWGPYFTISTLEKMAFTMNGFHIYPLLNTVLHPHPGVATLDWASRNKIRQMLRSAPVEAPGSTAYGAEGGWGSENRFIRGEYLQHEYFDAPSIKYYHGLDYMLLHNLYYISRPAEFRNVVPRLDGPRVPRMIAPDWPAALVNTTPAFGVGVPGTPIVINGCQWNAYVEVPITVYYTDPNGDKDTVAISVDSQPAGALVTMDGDKEHWKFAGPFWDEWWWEHSVGFGFRDEEGNYLKTEDWGLSTPIAYPGALRKNPEAGSIPSSVDVATDGAYGLLVWGHADWEITVYANDVNCVPYQEALWDVDIPHVRNVTHVSKSGNNTIKARTYWSDIDVVEGNTHTARVPIIVMNVSGSESIQYDVEWEFTGYGI